MKKYILFFSMFTLLHAVTYAQGWLWAEQEGSDRTEQLLSLCQDINQNLYLSSSVHLGLGGSSINIYLGSDTFTVLDGKLAIVKYNDNGVYQWAKLFDNGHYMNSSNVYVYNDKSNNNLYLFGDFEDSIRFDTTLLFAQGRDLFFARMNENGNILWAKRISGTGSEFEGIVSFENNGNIVINGLTTNGADIDTFNVPPGTFYVRYDTSGNCLNAKTVFQPADSVINFDRVEFNNISYLTGYFSGTAQFDTISLTSNGATDFFIAAMDKNFNFQWAKNIGGSRDDGGRVITCDNSAKLYVTGYFMDSISVANQVFYSPTIYGFILQADTNGVVNWFQQITGNINSNGGGPSIDKLRTFNNDLLYIGGNFSDTVQFGNQNIIANSPSDAFIASYDSSGNFLDVSVIGYGHVMGLEVDVAGNPIVAGDLYAPATLGSFSLGNYGLNDFFIAKHAILNKVPELQKTAGNSLHIYANPSEGEIRIRLPEEFLHARNLTLSIFDNSGKLVSQFTIDAEGENLLLNLNRLVSGMYQVILTDGRKKFTGKMEIQ